MTMRPRAPHRSAAALLTVLMLCVATACGATSEGGTASDGGAAPDGGAGESSGATASTEPDTAGQEPDDIEVRGAERPEPVAVRIPRVGIESSLVDLSLMADGRLEAPEEWALAGWYVDGPRPGAVGPAVVAGHVDSPTGPAVFADLDQVRPGDRIEIGGDAFIIQGEPVRDRERLVWTVDLRPA